MRGLLNNGDVLAWAGLAAMSFRVPSRPQAPFAMGLEGAVVSGVAKMSLALVSQHR